MAVKAAAQEADPRRSAGEDVQVLWQSRQIEAAQATLPVLALDEDRMVRQGEHAFPHRKKLCRRHGKAGAVIRFNRLVIAE